MPPAKLLAVVVLATLPEDKKKILYCEDMSEMTLNYLILINGRKCPEEVSMKEQLLVTVASVGIGVGCALMLEGLFPALVAFPLAMSIVGGLFSGAVYYGMHRITA